MTTSFRQRPVFFSSASSRIVSTDSCFAESMNAQVLTTSTSASTASAVTSWPACWTRPIITSESTRFFGQPRETKPIFMGTGYSGLRDSGLTRDTVTPSP